MTNKKNFRINFHFQTAATFLGNKKRDSLQQYSYTKSCIYIKLLLRSTFTNVNYFSFQLNKFHEPIYNGVHQKENVMKNKTSYPLSFKNINLNYYE